MRIVFFLSLFLTSYPSFARIGCFDFVSEKASEYIKLNHNVDISFREFQQLQPMGGKIKYYRASKTFENNEYRLDVHLTVYPKVVDGVERSCQEAIVTKVETIKL
jgi:hypothetical protein